MKYRYLIELFCRWFAGGIFIFSSIHKIINPCDMASILYQYHIFPAGIINLTAIVLPFVELLFGLALITGLLARGASLGIICILAVFILILSINFFRELEFSCGCFSKERDWCELFTDWYIKNHTTTNNIARIRLRTGCDIIRDIIFLIPASVAFLLLQRRLGKKNRRTQF